MAEITINIPALSDELTEAMVRVLEDISQTLDPFRSYEGVSSDPRPEPPQYIEFDIIEIPGNDPFTCRIKGSFIPLFTNCPPAMLLPVQRYCGAYFYHRYSFDKGSSYTTQDGDIYGSAVITNSVIILSLLKKGNDN